MFRILLKRATVSLAWGLVPLAFVPWIGATEQLPPRPPSDFGERSLATARDDRPADIGFDAPRVGFDCARAETTLTVTVDSADTLQNDTTGAVSELPGYSCFGWDESGPEQIYKLEVTEQLVLYAGLSDLQSDLDLFLLDDCDTDACIAHANTEFATLVAAGTYYLVVDGYQGAAGPYTLVISGHHQGVPEAICDTSSDLAAIPIDWPLAEARTDTLFGRPNLIQVYSCNPILRTGGEVWYAISLPPEWQLDANVTSIPMGLDPCLWLFDGCGPSPACLEFVDAGGAGEVENLSWSNDGNETVTVYLAIDSWRPPETVFDGIVTLAAPLVPLQQTSWSDLRRLYR